MSREKGDERAEQVPRLIKSTNLITNLPPAKDCQACFYNIRKSIRQATTRMVKAGEL
jgi:hypothetical protein